MVEHPMTRGERRNVIRTEKRKRIAADYRLMTPHFIDRGLIGAPIVNVAYNAKNYFAIAASAAEQPDARFRISKKSYIKYYIDARDIEGRVQLNFVEVLELARSNDAVDEWDVDDVDAVRQRVREKRILAIKLHVHSYANGVMTHCVRDDCDGWSTMSLPPVTMDEEHQLKYRVIPLEDYPAGNKRQYIQEKIWYKEL